MIDPSINPAAPISTLKVAQRQVVEIARALLDKAKIIAMDEPTSSLTPSEFERLADIIERLAASGVSIIYVSHKMDEVFRVCQRATVMRDGKVVGMVDLSKTAPAEVIAMMVGRELLAEEHQLARDRRRRVSRRGTSTRLASATFPLTYTKARSWAWQVSLVRAGLNSCARSQVPTR